MKRFNGGRLTLHMAGALPLGVDRHRPRQHSRLWRWWMTGAVLMLASAGVVVLTVRVLRAGLL